ncbi:LuxR C-terminal-related transcriptional regulator [Paracidovorax avenae]|uniref:LuxR C-terminal-related transcriptional regulator n=1 Tax=Paracidovorax avenae TaxID=80867 RepID=UPI000D20C3D6|nr:response regulator transcription factor [Paracidovorax avenae]AVT10388.1 DNA-binding response regulator [Paracidovorax avenae]AVT13516.1 DNA-binding response regulator [Paracidovorax avenae]
MPLSAFSRLPLAHYALVIDDHPLVARGMAEFLRLHPRLEEARHAHETSEALRIIASHGSPILALVDFWLAEGAATSFIDNLFAMSPGTRVLIVSADHHPAIVLKARASGAHGFIHKREPPETFHAAINAVLDGTPWFDSGATACLSSKATTTAIGATTPREIHLSPADLGLTPRQGQILALVLEGLPNKPIANALHLSEHTVKEHLTAILQKLGASNRVELISRLRGVRMDES